jgi:hypothetical protein
LNQLGGGFSIAVNSSRAQKQALTRFRCRAASPVTRLDVENCESHTDEMAEPFAGWKLARKSFENTEQDVINAIRDAQDRVLESENARGSGMVNPYTPLARRRVYRRLTDDRAAEMAKIIRRSLIAKPPTEIGADTVAWTVNAMMADLGRYYNHGVLSIRCVAKTMYVDGLPPNLDDSRLMKRVEAEIEIIVAEIQSQNRTPVNSAGLQPVNPKTNPTTLFIS